MPRKKTISLSVDASTYDTFAKRCRDQGVIISKQVERFMQKELDGEKK